MILGKKEYVLESSAESIKLFNGCPGLESLSNFLSTIGERVFK
jgi:hypothetical protein